jgi:hypothetical protein
MTTKEKKPPPTHINDHPFINLKQPLEPILMYMQIRQIRQKVVTHKHSQHDEIVNHSFQRIRKVEVGSDGVEFEVEVFAEETEMEEVECLCFEAI